MNENKKIYNLRMTIVKCVGVGAQNENVGMRSMQVRVIFLAKRVEMEHLAYLMSHFCIPNVSFLCQKENITFKRTKTSHYFFTLRVRNLNSLRYFEVYCLYCPNTS